LLFHFVGVAFSPLQDKVEETCLLCIGNPSVLKNAAEVYFLTFDNEIDGNFKQYVTNLLIKKLRSNFPNCQFKFIFVTLNVIVVHVYACIQNITQGLLMP